jgi:hypothetical protein
LVINGKKVEMPDVNEMLAQVNLKGKKLHTMVKDLAKPHIQD